MSVWLIEIERTRLVLVSILTVVLNGANTIAKTIESVLNQTNKNIEYIIIDGGSTDNTVSIAESFRPNFDLQGIPYKVVSQKDNGMYDALNRGAMLAQGELVGQINADDWYEIDAVETMLDLYDQEQYDVAWGSIRIQGQKNWIKHAKIGRLWSTSGWCHPGMFSKRQILLEFPYALESMYDDFDFITAVHVAGKKLVTTDHIISNFSFGKGGMSTKKGIKEVKKRVDITYGIYKKYGMSKLYWWYRWAYEIAKEILG